MSYKPPINQPCEELHCSECEVQYLCTKEMFMACFNNQHERLRDFHLRKSIRTTVKSRRYGLKMEVANPISDDVLTALFGNNE